MDYTEKYIKYKQKYLDLKESLYGGGKHSKKEITAAEAERRKQQAAEEIKAKEDWDAISNPSAAKAQTPSTAEETVAEKARIAEETPIAAAKKAQHDTVVTAPSEAQSKAITSSPPVDSWEDWETVKGRKTEKKERKEAKAAEELRKREAAEAEAKRLAAEAEAKRLAAEAEAKRLAAEAEAKRLAEEAQRQREAEEEAQRQRKAAAEAEAKRIAEEEAQRQREAAEAEAKRLAAEAEAKRLAADKAAADKAAADKAAADKAAADKAAADKAARSSAPVTTKSRLSVDVTEFVQQQNMQDETQFTSTTATTSTSQEERDKAFCRINLQIRKNCKLYNILSEITNNANNTNFFIDKIRGFDIELIKNTIKEKISAEKEKLGTDDKYNGINVFITNFLGADLLKKKYNDYYNRQYNIYIKLIEKLGQDEKDNILKNIKFNLDLLRKIVEIQNPTYKGIQFESADVEQSESSTAPTAPESDGLPEEDKEDEDEEESEDSSAQSEAKGKAKRGKTNQNDFKSSIMSLIYEGFKPPKKGKIDKAIDKIKERQTELIEYYKQYEVMKNILCSLHKYKDCFTCYNQKINKSICEDLHNKDTEYTGLYDVNMYSYFDTKSFSYVVEIPDEQGKYIKDLLDIINIEINKCVETSLEKKLKVIRINLQKIHLQKIHFKLLYLLKEELKEELTKDIVYLINTYFSGFLLTNEINFGNTFEFTINFHPYWLMNIFVYKAICETRPIRTGRADRADSQNKSARSVPLSLSTTGSTPGLGSSRQQGGPTRTGSTKRSVPSGPLSLGKNT